MYKVNRQDKDKILIQGTGVSLTPPAWVVARSGGCLRPPSMYMSWWCKSRSSSSQSGSKTQSPNGNKISKLITAVNKVNRQDTTRQGAPFSRPTVSRSGLWSCSYIQHQHHRTPDDTQHKRRLWVSISPIAPMWVFCGFDITRWFS